MRGIMGIISKMWMFTPPDLPSVICGKVDYGSWVLLASRGGWWCGGGWVGGFVCVELFPLRIVLKPMTKMPHIIIVLVTLSYFDVNLRSLILTSAESRPKQKIYLRPLLLQTQCWMFCSKRNVNKNTWCLIIDVHKWLYIILQITAPVLLFSFT